MNKSLIYGVIVVAVIGLVAFMMRSPKKSGNQPDTAATQKLTIVGSDTMVELVGKLADAYMQEHPDAKITVNGGGSGPGIQALISGSSDICSASRPLKDSEKAAAKAKGFDAIEQTVAFDGISIVVNPRNPLNEVTLDQLKQMYTGKVTDWKQVGGAAGPIQLLSRESSSGTYQFFQEHVLNKEKYAKAMMSLTATTAIINTTAKDAGSIGYAGLGYADGAKDRIKILKVKKDDKSPAVEPSEATVLDKTYPISRPLFFYTHGEATGASKAFLEYVMSDKGQQIVSEAGFVKVTK